MPDIRSFRWGQFVGVLLLMSVIGLGALGLIGIMGLVAMNSETQATIIGVLILQSRDELIDLLKRYNGDKDEEEA